jgi:tryptophanyl-tRNA synthetase
MGKPVILTGIRSNDEPTLGNYLGAFLPMVEMQQKHAGEYQINMFVPDLHSFTTPIEHGNLYDNTLKNIKYFIAAGLDIHNADTYIYRQSYIPAHSELAWILDCFTGFGEAARMVEFKDKTETMGSDKVTVGLFNYPVLMAADILLYGAEWIPVGEDQRQHIELTRDLAQRLNNKFGEIFVVPHDSRKQVIFAGRSEPVRIRSLTNPDKKMSKSISDPRGTILLSDSPDDAAKKIMSATTDSIGIIHYDWDQQAGISNLLQISALLSNNLLEDVIKEWEGKTAYGELKSAVAEQVLKFLMDFKKKLADINEQEMMGKLESSEIAMREAAGSTLLKVQKAVGLRPR